MLRIVVASSLLIALLAACAPADERREASASRPTSGPTLSPTSQATDGKLPDDKVLDRILAQHVKDGRVDYKGLRKSKSDLDSYVTSVEQADDSLLKSNAQKIAFWVNAYNAHILKLVRDRPKLKSVLDEKGFFDKQTVKVSGESLTLNALEAKARKLGDPRVHFIVNCASASCPILESKAYRASDLEKRLAQATKRYLKDKTHGLAFDDAKKTVALSEIFKWYAKDFASSGKTQDVVAWIAKQLDKKTSAKLTNHGTKVTWKTYDWTLNAKK